MNRLPAWWKAFDPAAGRIRRLTPKDLTPSLRDALSPHYLAIREAASCALGWDGTDDDIKVELIPDDLDGTPNPSNHSASEAA